jgi:RNA polymerase sigma factor (TIGR02999 family)
LKRAGDLARRRDRRTKSWTGAKAALAFPFDFATMHGTPPEDEMTSPTPGAVTQLLARAKAGNAAALEELVPLVYAELRRIAGRYVRHERAGHSLQATALVHEAYIRLIKDEDLTFENRAHFLGIAARSMRQILVEHARARDAEKRGGERQRVTLDEGVAAGGPADVDLLALEEALERLAALNADHARIVELRFFGGLTNEETAAALDISPATVKRAWAVARAWLFREMTR